MRRQISIYNVQARIHQSTTCKQKTPKHEKEQIVSLQKKETLPKLRLSTDFIGGPELHTVDLRLLISSSRQSSPNHLVLMKLCREKLKVKNKLKKRTPPESSASIHVFLHLSVSNSLLLITNHKLQTEGKTDHCQTVSRTAYDLPGKSP